MAKNEFVAHVARKTPGPPGALPTKNTSAPGEAVKIPNLPPADLVPSKARTTVALSGNLVVPAAIATAGERATRRFLEFFAATIRNRNTREAYYRAACSFFAWLDQNGITTLDDIEPLHVSIYI